MTALNPERYAHVMWLHRQVPVIDCHNDSLYGVKQGDTRYNPLRHRPPRRRRLWQKSESGHWDFPRALEAGQTGQVTNLLLPRMKTGPLIKLILTSHRQLQMDLTAAPEMALLATTAADIEGAHRERKIAMVTHIEGGEGIDDDLDVLHVFHQLGVRSVGLTWMYRNAMAEGNWEDTGAGLSDFGRRAVHEMNQLRILVDVAHASEKTFWDALEASEAPVICSHTSCRAMVKDFDTHAPSRYLTDEQMKGLAAQDGVLGIFFSANRELDDDTAGVTHLARFIAHAAAAAGPAHVGFGSDLDGGFPPHGLEDVRGLPNLTSALIDLGFSDTELLGILGGNWLRVFRRVWGA